MPPRSVCPSATPSSGLGDWGTRILGGPRSRGGDRTCRIGPMSCLCVPAMLSGAPFRAEPGVCRESMSVPVGSPSAVA